MKKFFLGIFLIVFLIVVLCFLYLNLNNGKETAIQAIEEIRKENAVEYVIYEDYHFGGVFIYYLNDINNDSPTLSAEYVRNTFRGKWKWVYGGGHSGTHLSLVGDYDVNGIPFSYQYLPVLDNKQFRIPFPVIFGAIFDPEIMRVVVRDYRTGLERQVNIIEVNERFRFYFVNVTESQGKKFDVIAFNGKNEILYKETFDEEIQAFGSAGKKHYEINGWR